jgi:hypothetical protein
MDANVERDMKRAVSSGNINRALVAYLEARLADTKSQLIVAGEQTFKQLQGRAQELQELIKSINLSREP